MNQPVQRFIDERLDKYDKFRELVNDPVIGMRAKGFTEEEVQAALEHIEDVQVFYEDLLDTF